MASAEAGVGACAWAGRSPGVGDGTSQGEASSWAAMISSMLASPPGGLVC